MTSEMLAAITAADLDVAERVEAGEIAAEDYTDETVLRRAVALLNAGQVAAPEPPRP